MRQMRLTRVPKHRIIINNQMIRIRYKEKHTLGHHTPSKKNVGQQGGKRLLIEASFPTVFSEDRPVTLLP